MGVARISRVKSVLFDTFVGAGPICAPTTHRFACPSGCCKLGARPCPNPQP